jgi:OOP family OmpA-OmpF porin
MRKRFIIIYLALAGISSSQTASAQLADFNRLAVDFSAGINKPMASFTPGYFGPKLAGPIHVDLGVRYMANSKFGVKLGYGMESFKITSGNTTYKTSYNNISIQALMNIGRVCSFEDWTKSIGLFVHAGAGIGILGGTPIGGVKSKDRTGLFIAGFTPIFRVTEKISITADLSMVGTVKQDNTFDFQTRISRQGFDGYYATMSAGISISLGKKDKNIDWKFGDNDLKARIDSLEVELIKTQTRIENIDLGVKAIETSMKDDDNDGVANYLDSEPDTQEGSIVNTHGQKVESPVFDDLFEDPAVTGGLFFTVQLGVYSRMIPEQFWRNIKPIYVVKIEDGTRRFFTGIFHSVEEASTVLTESKNKGVTDAFITAYFKGRRITVAEADLILSSKGPSVLRKKP